MGGGAHVLLAIALSGVAVAGEIRGGVLAGSVVLSWGDELRRHDPDTGASRVLKAPVSYGAGGCLMDANHDGVQDLVVLERSPDGGGNMIWLEAPDWRRRLIDTDADFADCLEATLFGRRGLLVIHRQAQVRFYDPPPDGERWPYREIYSVYTPSAQGGLELADVDQDGRADILCGNYWIRAPAGFDLPWRLFAINDWWEGPRSAMLRLALDGRHRLVAAQREASPARVSLFERPPDPTQFWIESKLEATGGIHRPSALLAMNGTFYLGEDRGEESRLLVYRGGTLVEAARIGAILRLWRWRSGLLVLGADGVTRWPQPRR